jgi:hypothetical protein
MLKPYAPFILSDYPNGYVMSCEEHATKNVLIVANDKARATPIHRYSAARFPQPKPYCIAGTEMRLLRYGRLSVGLAVGEGFCKVRSWSKHCGEIRS